MMEEDLSEKHSFLLERQALLRSQAGKSTPPKRKRPEKRLRGYLSATRRKEFLSATSSFPKTGSLGKAEKANRKGNAFLRKDPRSPVFKEGPMPFGASVTKRINGQKKLRDGNTSATMYLAARRQPKIRRRKGNQKEVTKKLRN